MKQTLTLQHPAGGAATDPGRHGGLEIPSVLHASVARHRQHLAALLVNLRAAGIDEGTIDRSVSMLIEAYRVELTLAIRNIVEEDTHD